MKQYIYALLQLTLIITLECMNYFKFLFNFA